MHIRSNSPTRKSEMKPTSSEITTQPKQPFSQTGTQAGEHGLATQESFRAAYPTPTPRHSKLLSPQELQDHRRQIASEVKIVLSSYFRPFEDDEVRAGQLAWWCDELQDWTSEQVVWGLRQWNRENSRARPTPGDILGLLTAMRGKREAAKLNALPKPAEEERMPVTKERAQQIMEAAGFAPKTFTSNRENEQ
jgi:hypothetical protein